jgi:hypothetical protein
VTVIPGPTYSTCRVRCTEPESCRRSRFAAVTAEHTKRPVRVDWPPSQRWKYGQSHVIYVRFLTAYRIQATARESHHLELDRVRASMAEHLAIRMRHTQRCSSIAFDQLGRCPNGSGRKCRFPTIIRRQQTTPTLPIEVSSVCRRSSFHSGSSFGRRRAARSATTTGCAKGPLGQQPSRRSATSAGETNPARPLSLVLQQHLVTMCGNPFRRVDR